MKREHTIGAVPFPVRFKRAGHAAPALVKGRGQVALHQAEPGAVRADLVLGIDGSDRILKIDDRRQRGFEDDISDAERVGRTDGMLAINHQFDMQAIVTEQFSPLAPADEMRVVLPTGNRRVEESACARNDGGTAFGVVATRLGRCRIKHIGAIKSVVQAAPARVRGVESKAGVERGDDQLRPCHCGDFGIDICGVDAEWRGFGDEVTDVGQERLISCRVPRLPRPCAMPCVDLCLKVVALGEQRPVDRRKTGKDVGKTRPQHFGRHTRPRQSLCLDKIGKDRRDAQTGAGNIGHAGLP